MTNYLAHPIGWAFLWNFMMRILTEYPISSHICFDELANKALLKHINEPFTNEKEALSFWQNTSTLVVAIEPLDNYLPLLHCFNKRLISLIHEALEYPEYEEPLSDEYRFNLTVFNDDGSGLYLVYPTIFKEQLFNAVNAINNPNL